MNATILNQQLREIYQPYLDALYNEVWEEGVSAPLLMHVFDEYPLMNRKVLVVGQETHSWYEMKAHLTVEDLQEKYADFNLGKAADYPEGRKYLRSPFWNFSRSLFYTLNQHLPAVSRQTNGFLWTNISKFDHNSTTPNLDLQQRNAVGFELLKAEIAVVQPDIVVFLTGSKYDNWLEKLFKPRKEPLLDNKTLYQLDDTTGLLPYFSFQTKHPRTLCQEKSYREVLDKMIETVQKES